MSSFSVQPEPVAADQGSWSLTVTGEFDTAAVTAFDAAFDAAVDDGARSVTLDLVDVSFIDSSGLRSIARASNRLAERNGRLTVAGLSGAAQQVLEIAGLLERLAGGAASDEPRP